MALPLNAWTLAELESGYEALAVASPVCRAAARWSLSAQLVALRPEDLFNVAFDRFNVFVLFNKRFNSYFFV